MASIRIFSGALQGLDAIPIEVEVDATPGLHFFSIVGLPDKTVEESKDRITSALRNCGFVSPKQKNQRIIVNLAPADIKKEGPGYDLPIAIGYLIATKQLKNAGSKVILAGELSLDGSLRKITGALSLALMAKKRGFQEIILPAGNMQEVSIVDSVSLVGANTLKEVADHLKAEVLISPTPAVSYKNALNSAVSEQTSEIDLVDIKGQESAKRALLIAASGNHNLLMYGPPGTGKTLLARALPGIMPPLSRDEALEVTKIYSVSGLLDNERIITQRPFRDPHHTTSAVAIVGGGSVPKPGEISLAHKGVLFLDEFPEFPRNVIEALRQPMESGNIVVSRATATSRFPARFMLVAAMNPCPCGNYQDEINACVCTPPSIAKYKKRVSGPIMDRLDIHMLVPRETYEKLSEKNRGSSSADYQKLVLAARDIQRERFVGTKISTNSEIGPKNIDSFCERTADVEKLLKHIMASHGISGRGFHKLLKISRTIADLANSEKIESQHIAEAASYRIQLLEA